VRYYEVKYPGSNEWVSTPSVRGRTYPEGTKIRVVVTDRDGTLLDSWASGGPRGSGADTSGEAERNFLI